MKAPYFVDWGITNVCDLKCIYCGFKFKKKSVSTDTAIRIVKEIADLNPKWLIIEGGEPFLRLDFMQILQNLAEYRIDTNVLTSGMFLDEKNIANIRKIGAKLMLSFDGGTKSTYESIKRGASFDKAVDAIKKCIAHDILESVNYTLLKANYLEIPVFLKLMADLEVPKVIFIPLKPPSNIYREQALSAAEYENAIKLVCEHTTDKYDIFFDEPFFYAMLDLLGKDMIQRTQSRIYAPEDGCIFGKYMFIRHDGSVRPCMFSPIEHGDVHNQSIVQIWNDMMDDDLIKKIHKPVRTGFCENCAYLKVCKGCRVRSFFYTNNWFGSDPACPVHTKKSDVKCE
jgi:radical SAM protein with 4Fe4S-binding SPASM domain